MDREGSKKISNKKKEQQHFKRPQDPEKENCSNIQNCPGSKTPTDCKLFCHYGFSTTPLSCSQQFPPTENSAVGRLCTRKNYHKNYHSNLFQT